MSAIDSRKAVSSLRWAIAMGAAGLILMLVPLAPFFRGQFDPRIFILGDIIVTPTAVIIAALLGGSVAWFTGAWFYVAHLARREVRSSRRHRVVRAVVSTAAVIGAIAALCLSAFVVVIAILSFPISFLILPESSPAGCRVVLAMSDGMSGTHGDVFLARPGENILVKTDIGWKENDENRFALQADGRWRVSWDRENAVIELRGEAGDPRFQATGSTANCVQPG